MAVSSSFKQKCPSCEAMVTIRDPGLIGKKVECSKCKYRFVVESPVEQDKAATQAKANGNGNGKNGNGPQVKAGPAKADGKKRFEDDDLETKGKAKAKAKAAPKKRARDEDDEEEDDAPKKGSGTPLKLLIGLLLGFVGLGVLAVCAWLIIAMNRSPAPPPPPPGGPGTTPPMAGMTPPGPGGDPAAPAPGTTPPPGQANDGKKETKPAAAPVAVKGPGPEVTNLLPGDSEHVFHLFMKDVFEPGGSLYDAVFQEPGSLAGVNFKKRIGFDLTTIADLIRAERYSAPAWSMTTLFLAEPIDEGAVVAALGLKQATPIKGKAYYKAERPNPTFEQLARFSFGVPQNVRVAAAKANRPLFVRFHTPQTLIVADEEPLVALLKANGHFPEQTPRPAAPAPAADPSANPAPGMAPPGAPMGPAFSPPMAPPGAPMGPAFSPPMAPPGAPMAPPMPMTPPTKGPMSVSPAAPNIVIPGSGRLDLPPGAERVGFFTVPAETAPALVGQAASGPTPMQNPPATTPMGPAASPMPPGAPQTTTPGMPPMGPASNPPMGPPGAPMMPPGPAAPGMMPPGATPPATPATPPAGSGNPRDEMYLTIKPRLKAMLDKMEVLPDGSKDRVLFSAVTDLEAARIVTSAPEFKNQVVRVPREFWDITYLLEEPRPGLRLIGAALIQKDSRNFQFKNELHCSQDLDAKEFYKQLQEKGCPQLARFFDKLLEHKIALPKEEKDPSEQPGNGPPTLNPPGPPGAPKTSGPAFNPGPMSSGPAFNPGPMSGTTPQMKPPGYPGTTPQMKPPGYPGTTPGYYPPGTKPPGTEPAPKEKEEPTASQITLSRDEKTISFGLDLIMDKGTFDRTLSMATLTAGMLRVDIDLASIPLRHDLAKAARQAAEKGMTDSGVPPGSYPPGAFPPLELKTRQSQEPKNRISWMAGLLPFIGQESLHARISFKHNWRDPANWIAGRAVVPEFLDPTYPDATRQVLVGGVPSEFGATHVVGVAGVGLDAASYPRDDPAFVAKRGIFGYDKSATLKEVQDGRGLSNAIAMLQVPHDGPAGVTPWIAGGGATLRGVPEKNSVAPFVLSTDRSGKVIQHNGKRGTYAMMADGSVRFIDQNVSDDVFKAMCTVGGGAPDNFSPATNPHTPLVNPPRKDDVKPEPAVPVKPVVKPAAPAAPAKPAADAKVPAGWVTFQGDGFSVAMPLQPVVQTVDAPNIGKVTVHVAALPDKKGNFSVALVKLPEPLMAQIKSLGPDGLKQLAQMGAPKGVKFVRDTPVTQDGHAGREFALELDLPQVGKLVNTTRLFVLGDRVLTLDVNATGALPAEAAAFFGSLKIGG